MHLAQAAKAKLVRTGADNETVVKEDSPLSDVPDEAEPDRKKLREEVKGMTIEEYEAMLDAEAQDGEGGFLEGGDIPEATEQNA